MKAINDLQTSQYYSLSEMFATPNRKIIIPDFQRDYCWGDATHGTGRTDLVHGFIESIANEVKNGQTLLGKIDVYQNPKNHIYLTDGQQRLTTLYLIIGMLYRETKDTLLKDCLISEEEESNDDKEPYLQYSIRESSISFLKDLVNEFFIKDTDLRVNDIKTQYWFFSEYNLDPTINSMLKALVVIEKYLKTKENLDLVQFSKFIINDIKFQYHDVSDRKHGEERFVIINTTGKNLTDSENVKPILLGQLTDKTFSEQWERMETWFWANRNKAKEVVADDGINSFLKWFFNITEKSESVDVIKNSRELRKQGEARVIENLILMNEYFEALKTLIKLLQCNETINRQFMFINNDKEVLDIIDIRGLSMQGQQRVLLPLLAFITKISSNEEEIYQFLRRLRKNYFDGLWNERTENFVEWQLVLEILEKSKNLMEVLTFDSEKLLHTYQGKTLKGKWFNKEEEMKRILKSAHNVEIEEMEDDADFMGDLSPLLSVSKESLEFKIVQSYFNTYKAIGNGSHDYFKNTSSRNRYFLYDLLYYGNLNYGTVNGRVYCMLQQNSKKPFLKDGFLEVWERFNSQSVEDLLEYLRKKTADHYVNRVFNLPGETLADKLENTSKISNISLIKIWLMLEVINAENEKIDFTNAVASFLRYPNLVKIFNPSENREDDYQLGNSLLGTSYYNNKGGWLYFNHFPLMNKMRHKRESITEDEIRSTTGKYILQLTGEFTTSQVS